MGRNAMGQVRKKRSALLILTAMLAMGSLAGCQKKEEANDQLSFRKTGIHRMNAGKYGEAVEFFQKALDQSKAVVGETELDICYYKAVAQYNSGDTKGAMETCGALLDYNKKDARAYYLRGCMNLKEEKGKEALADFENALAYCGKDYEVYISVYEGLLAIGYENKATETLKKALKLEGNTAEDYRERGHIYYLMEDYKSAKKELDKAIKEKDSKARLYLAQVYEADGEAKKANDLYEIYMQENKDDTSVMVKMGEAQMASGKYQEALEFFQKILDGKNTGQEQQIRRNEIIAYENLLDFSTAKEKMAAYIEDYPDDEAAQREHQFLQTR
ncbi:tetratricopeptide repeat protein [Lachnospiraceae bacterium 29-84]